MKTNLEKTNPLKQNRENEPDFTDGSDMLYDDDSIGAAINMAFDRVIRSLNELREIIKQL